MSDPGYYPYRSPIATGLACRCPRCGQGRLYGGFLTVAETCDVCGLDLRKADSGDGPAVFIIFILGVLVVPLALLFEAQVAPPLWLHGHTAIATVKDWRDAHGPTTVANVTGSVVVELVPPA